MPGTLNLEIYTGDRYEYPILFQDGDDAPLDMSGTWRAQIRVRPTDATVVAEFEVDDTDAATGRLVLLLTATQTTALPDHPCVWDLENTEIEKTYLAGSVTVDRDVTR